MAKKDENIRELLEKAKAGIKEVFKTENYRNYLKTMSKFHSYSYLNSRLILQQNPDATHVAGYNSWKTKFNRNVKRGEKGIKVIAYAPKKMDTEENKKDSLEKVTKGDDRSAVKETGTKIIPRYVQVYVYDVSQTEGEPLPKLANELFGKVKTYEDLLQTIRDISPFPILFKNIDGETKGCCNLVKRQIFIQDGMSESHTIKTAIHEVVHANLHDDSKFINLIGDVTDSRTKEVEAESTAFVVCSYYGIDTSEYSFPYLAAWSSTKELKELQNSLEIIHKQSSELIEKIDARMAEIKNENENTVSTQLHNEDNNENEIEPLKQSKLFDSISLNTVNNNIHSKMNDKENERQVKNMELEKNKKNSDVPTKQNFTKEQLSFAKDVDLLNYVDGRYEVKPHGSGTYKVIIDGSDNLIIFKNTNSWYDFKNAVGGDIVSFLNIIEGKSVVEAVRELSGVYDINETFNRRQVDRDKDIDIIKGDFTLPVKDENSYKVIEYLVKQRGIDKSIVLDCIDNGSIYQSRESVQKGEKEYIFNNAIFVGFDENQEVQYASKRSINDNYEYIIKQDIKNSSKEFGFIIKGSENSNWVHVCESPIDALSIATMNKMNNTNINEHIISLGGVSDKALEKFLEINDVNVISLCLDNDEAGQKSSIKLKEKYDQLGYFVFINPSRSKDYNLDLQNEREKEIKSITNIPQKSDTNKSTFMFLTSTKQIEKEVVNKLLKQGSVYQTEKEVVKSDGSKFMGKSTMFVNKDERGLVTYAISISNTSNNNTLDFKTEYKNQVQARNFIYHKGNNETLLVFNNPISMITQESFLRDNGKTNNNHMVCSLVGHTNSISEIIKENPMIREVKVMLDKTVYKSREKEIVDYRDIVFNKIKASCRKENSNISVIAKYSIGVDLNKDYISFKEKCKEQERDKYEENSYENEL